MTDDITIHLYALCWNEEKMLPYFFRHYDGTVDQYFIADNRSSDRSVEILRSHPKVTLSTVDFEGDSFIQAAQAHYNHCWKQSRGKADWVIVCNVDEHLYHRNLRTYLRRCREKGFTVIVPEGYQMVSETFPGGDEPLYRSVRYGQRHRNFDKPQIFNPNEIQEINFDLGRHRASPVGGVHLHKSKIKLLHFKYIGLDYVLPRLSQLGSRMRSADIQNRWGIRYVESEQEKIERFRRIERNSVRVLSLSGYLRVRASPFIERAKKRLEHIPIVRTIYFIIRR